MVRNGAVLRAVVDQIECQWLATLDEPSSKKKRILTQLRKVRPRKFEDETWDIAIPSLGDLFPPRMVEIEWTDLTARLVPDESFPGDVNAGKFVIQLEKTIAESMGHGPNRGMTGSQLSMPTI